MPVSKNRRKKPKKKSTKAARNKTRRVPLSEDAPPVPDRRAMERMMSSLTEAVSLAELVGEQENALRQAQELMYDAWEMRAARERIRLAKRALKLSDLCADAHSLLSEDEAKTLVEARAHYVRAVDAGKRAIEPQAFERNSAINHLRDMLLLNPNDNQGLRYVLASWLLAIRGHDALEKLLADYDGDGAAEWAFNETLLALRMGDESRAHSALAVAWKRNPHIPALLIGAARMPELLEDYYALGSHEEAAFYVLQNKENWLSTEGATPWLAKNLRTLPPPEREKRWTGR